MSRKRNKGLKIDEELNMLENILEEQGEARRFTKEEEKKILIYQKPWMDEFLNGKLIALTKKMRMSFEKSIKKNTVNILRSQRTNF